MSDLKKIMQAALSTGSMTQEERDKVEDIIKSLSEPKVERFGIEAESSTCPYVATELIDGGGLMFTTPSGSMPGKVYRESQSGYIVKHGEEFFYVSKSFESNLTDSEIESLGLPVNARD